MLVSPKLIVENAGKAGAVLYTVLDIAFLVTAVVYFYQTIVYVRYLINEKCKCSEDMRRDLLMWGSIIEIILIVQILLLSMILPIIGECSMSILNTIDSTRDGLSNAIHRPIDGIRETPSNIDKILNKTLDTSKKVLQKVSSKFSK
eukprot:768657-Hanusia_phi.AAC.12